MDPDMIALVSFPGISTFHLAVPTLVFGEDRREDGLPDFKLRICAVTPGPLITSCGLAIEVPLGLDCLAEAGTIIVPSWRDPLKPPPAILLQALRDAHDAGARIVGLCLGAFVLAEAGLLDDRPATTHWLWAERFAARYPRVRVDPRVLYIDDGDVVTSAGTAAGIDCCLHLLRNRVGARVTNRLARRLIVPPHRPGGQAQFIEQPVAITRSDEKLSNTLAWARTRLAETLTVDGLADHAGMSRRTFTRRFQRLTGTTVITWVVGQRLALVQQLLEATDLSIEQIASRAGFGTALSLRLHFLKAFETTPSAYRRTFQGTAPAAEGSADRPAQAFAGTAAPAASRR
ncbi:MAG: helix-turn-helix domain-containing protein [Azospirillaceae bacterium]|nr:helix-turn-helix domain-containing protein [Azospirillaceae bacterium]